MQLGFIRRQLNFECKNICKKTCCSLAISAFFVCSLSVTFFLISQHKETKMRPRMRCKNHWGVHNFTNFVARCTRAIFHRTASSELSAKDDNCSSHFPLLWFTATGKNYTFYTFSTVICPQRHQDAFVSTKIGIVVTFECFHMFPVNTLTESMCFFMSGRRPVCPLRSAGT